MLAGVHSADDHGVREALGYDAGPGLVFPYSLNGGDGGFYARVKLDKAGPDGKRYRSPKNQSNRLYIPPLLERAMLSDPNTPVWITEGEKKCLKAIQEGLLCIAIPGVWSWKTRDSHDRSVSIQDLDVIAWRGRTVYIVFDSDLATNPSVKFAEFRLAQELRKRGAQVYAVRLPSGPNEEKVGLDDYLMSHSIEALCQIEPVEIHHPAIEDHRKAATVEEIEEPAEEPDDIPGDEPYQLATSEGSFITRYVRYGLLRTDAPAGAHEGVAVGLLSALAGPGPRLPLAFAPRGWILALWILYLVNSTTGRKSVVLDLAQDLATEVLGATAFFNWEGSPQGFIQALAARDGLPTIFCRDEYAGLLGQMNRAGGHLAGLRETLIRAYDGRPLENKRTRKRNKRSGEQEEDTDLVRNPYLVTLAAAVRDGFIQRATIDDILTGFLPRFVILDGIAPTEKIKRFTPEIERRRLELLAHAQTIRDRAVRTDRLDFTDEVLEAYTDLESEWRAVAERSPKPEAAGPSLKRLGESVLKTAALIALDESPETPSLIELSHLETARVIGHRWLGGTLRLLRDLGTTRFQKDCDAILRTIQQHADGIAYRTLYRQHRRLKPKEIEEALSALEMQGETKVTRDPQKRGGWSVVKVYPARRRGPA